MPSPRLLIFLLATIVVRQHRRSVAMQNDKEIAYWANRMVVSALLVEANLNRVRGAFEEFARVATATQPPNAGKNSLAVPSSAPDSFP